MSIMKYRIMRCTITGCEISYNENGKIEYGCVGEPYDEFNPEFFCFWCYAAKTYGQNLLKWDPCVVSHASHTRHVSFNDKVETIIIHQIIDEEPIHEYVFRPPDIQFDFI
jgi:hypothetical protein